jgi:hypothetical protein
LLTGPGAKGVDESCHLLHPEFCAYPQARVYQNESTLGRIEDYYFLRLMKKVVNFPSCEHRCSLGGRALREPIVYGVFYPEFVPEAQREQIVDGASYQKH